MVALQQSKLVATAGGQGTTMEGSPMEVYLANAKQGELEAQDQAYAGLLRAHAKRLEALNAKQRGNAGLTTGLIGAVSPILSKLA
jgi:molybdopterin-biosynthesis enzyme MoeA-like protein